jgi:dihydroorotate dehydrogenase electron transfer subunit
MHQFSGRIALNAPCGPKCRKIRVEVPERLVRYEPGQFFHVRCGPGTDPLLRRPFSVYAVATDAGGWVRHLDFLILVVGHGTRTLATVAAGGTLDLLGPLGKGFRPPAEPARHVMVAGGVGIAPFYDLSEHLIARAVGGPAPRITLLFGSRTMDELYALDEIRRLGIEIRLATDDGSAGRRGFVTELLPDVLEAPSTGSREPGTRNLQIYACGPEPMLDAVTRIARERNVPAQLSLDRRMGCGLGACGACVCKVASPEAPDGWDYIRICREGPVVDANRLVP